ncbi:MAG TPA: MEDS domain-containing protein, partial [Terriglobales bacterium]|nr:MEDS domain-containing protein [Terriglobales bacterium]
CHEVGFYSHDRFLLNHLTQFIGTALKAKHAAIVIATESHRNSLLLSLQGYGVDAGAEIERGRCILLDAAETLSAVMVNGMLDEARFLTSLADLIGMGSKAAEEEHAPVAVYGECVQLLWAQENIEAVIQLEKAGNELIKTHNADILCGYSPGIREGGMDRQTSLRICAEHSAVHQW